MYGEASDGKVYKDGVQVTALVEADEQTTTTDEFGPDFGGNIEMYFYREILSSGSINFYL